MLGTSKLANGEYVLRSIADPMNKLYESANKSGANELDADNQGLSCFKVKSNSIRIVSC